MTIAFLSSLSAQPSPYLEIWNVLKNNRWQPVRTWIWNVYVPRKYSKNFFEKNGGGRMNISCLFTRKRQFSRLQPHFSFFFDCYLFARFEREFLSYRRKKRRNVAYLSSCLFSIVTRAMCPSHRLVIDWPKLFLDLK